MYDNNTDLSFDFPHVSTESKIEHTTNSFSKNNKLNKNKLSSSVKSESKNNMPSYMGKLVFNQNHIFLKKKSKDKTIG